MSSVGTAGEGGEEMQLLRTGSRKVWLAAGEVSPMCTAAEGTAPYEAGKVVCHLGQFLPAASG